MTYLTSSRRRRHSPRLVSLLLLLVVLGIPVLLWSLVLAIAWEVWIHL